MRKKLFCMLLVCLLSISWVGSCSAAAYTMTEEELTKLETIFEQLKIHNRQLLNELAASNQDLTLQRTKLQDYQKELETLHSQLVTLKIESAKVKQDLLTAQTSLQKANESLDKYEREARGQIKSLTWQRNLLGLLAILAVKK